MLIWKLKMGVKPFIKKCLCVEWRTKRPSKSICNVDKCTQNKLLRCLQLQCQLHIRHNQNMNLLYSSQKCSITASRSNKLSFSATGSPRSHPAHHVFTARCITHFSPFQTTLTLLPNTLWTKNSRYEHLLHNHRRNLGQKKPRTSPIRKEKKNRASTAKNRYETASGGPRVLHAALSDKESWSPSTSLQPYAINNET